MSTAPSSTASVSNNLRALIQAVGECAVLEYRNKHFAPVIIAACPEFYSLDNAATWININTFMQFVAECCQNPVPRTPQHSGLVDSSSPISHSTPNNLPPKHQYSPSPSWEVPSSPTAHLSAHHANLLSFNSELDKQQQHKSMQKHKRDVKISKAEQNHAAGLTQITRELWVKDVIYLDHVPEAWEVPEEGDSVAYILDLTKSPFDFRDQNGKPRSMAAIIKNKGTDAWGEGSGGSKKAGPKLLLLDNIQGQRAIHRCRGSFPCSFADMDALSSCTHYKPDKKAIVQQSEENCEASMKEQESPVGIASAFYKSVAFRSCPYNNGKCNGQPMMRSFAKMNHQGKSYFIGCSAWQPEHVFSQPNSWIKASGMPPDETIRKAIIVPTSGKPHNHICFPAQKRTFEACELYVEALQQHGLISATVLEVDKAAPTQKILNSDLAVASNARASLLKARFKRDIITEEKKKKYPRGTGIEGIVHMFETGDSKKAPNERYIQAMYSEPCEDIGETIHVIVTMLPELAGLVHNVHSTQHDTTYKWVHGKFNEWEVVIWDTRLNRCVCISRIYCNRETRQAYRIMWKAWFDSIHKVTGKPLLNKRLHGKGKHAIFMVDASVPQVQGLGDVLVQLNEVIDTNDPLKIVEFVLRTCFVHFRRNLEPIKSVVSTEEFEYIQMFPYIYEKEAMESFKKWCTNQHDKVKEWMRQKEAHPWIIPSLCRHFSEIWPEDWDLGPSDSNLNESSHPATNRLTGTNLALTEAVEAAFEVDRLVVQDRKNVRDEGNELNSRGSLTQRLTANGNRAVNRLKKAHKDHETRAGLRALQQEILVAQEESREKAQRLKELRMKKKEFSGGKKWNLRVSGRGQTTPSFALPSVSSSNKENNPFVSAGLSRLTPSPSYPIILDPELEFPPITHSHQHIQINPHKQHNFAHPSVQPHNPSPFIFPSSSCPARYGTGTLMHADQEEPFYGYGNVRFKYEL